jgi:hypothetical protein
MEGFDNSGGVYPAPSQASFGLHRASPDLNLLRPAQFTLTRFNFRVLDFPVEEKEGKIGGGPGHLFDINPDHGKER